jgi:hypothetical protein
MDYLCYYFMGMGRWYERSFPNGYTSLISRCLHPQPQGQVWVPSDLNAWEGNCCRMHL